MAMATSTLKILGSGDFSKLNAEFNKLLSTVKSSTQGTTKLLKSMEQAAGQMGKTFDGTVNLSTNKFSLAMRDLSQSMQMTFPSFKQAQAHLMQLQQAARAFLPAGHDLNLSIKKVGNAFQVTGGQIVDSSKQGIKGLLNLQAFVGKIVHYITFSIGVQMVMGVRQGFTDMIDDTKKFERAATNAATVAGYLGGSFESMKEHIEDVSKTLGRKTIFSALDVADAYYNLASAGYDVANIGEKELIPILNYAAATQSSLEDATYAVSTALKAFSMEFEEASRVVDVFTGAITNSFMTFEKMREAMKYVAPIAGSLGISLEETVSALMQLVDRGMEGSQAGQRLNMIFTKLLKPTEKAEQMLASMGLTMKDLNPEIYTLTEILYKLQAAGFGAAEAATMFRARTAASATVLVESVDSIARYNAMLQSTVGITQSVAEQQEQTLWGAFKLMSNTLQEVGLELGNKLIPFLTSFTNYIKSSFGPALHFIVDLFSMLIPVLKVLLPAWLIYRTVTIAIKTAMSLLIGVKTIYLYLLSREITTEKTLGLLRINEILHLNETRKTISSLIATRKAELGLRKSSLMTMNLENAGLKKNISTRLVSMITKQKEAIVSNKLLTFIDKERVRTMMLKNQKELLIASSQKRIATAYAELSATNKSVAANARFSAYLSHDVKLRAINTSFMKKDIAVRKLGQAIKAQELLTMKAMGASQLTLLKLKLKDTIASIKASLGNLAYTKSVIAAKTATIAFGRSLKALLVNPVFLAIAALVTIIGVISILIKKTDDMNVAMDDFMDVDISHLPYIFDETTAAVFEATQGMKGLDEAIRILSRDGIYSAEEMRDAFSDALAFEDYTKQFTELRGFSIFGGLGAISDLANIHIPILSDIDDWVKDQTLGLFGLKDDFLLATYQMREAALVMAATKKFPDSSGPEALELLKNLVGARKMSLLLANEIVGLNIDIRDLTDAYIAENKALDELEEAKTELLDTEEQTAEELDNLKEKTYEYNKAKKERVRLETEALTSIKMLITESRKYSEAVDKGVGYLEDMFKAQSNVRSKSEELDRVLINEEKATIALADAIARYGAESSEAVDAEIDLIQVSKERAEISQEIADLEDEAAQAAAKRDYMLEYGITGEYNIKELYSKGLTTKQITDIVPDELKDAKTGKITDIEFLKGEKEVEVTYELTESDRALLDITERVMKAREDYTSILTEEIVLKAKLQALETIREEAIKLTNEKLKLYLEAQKKIYDIEEKLYKLREGEKDQYEDLFEKLASEGLINDEVIDLYKELEIAEGEVLGMNHGLMEVYGDLSDEQRDYAEALINTKEGTEEYDKALAALEGTGLTQEQIDYIIAYNRAEDRLVDATLAFGSAMGPLMNDLIDAGIVSPEVAAAWYDIADNGYETALANIELDLALTKVNETMVGLIGNSVRLAKALMDENTVIESGRDSASDLFDVYKQYDESGKLVENYGKTVIQVMLEEMELWDLLGGNINAVSDEISRFWEEDLDAMTDAEIATAIAMIQAANASGLWADDLTAASFAVENHLGSLAMMEAEGEAAWKSQESMVDIFNELAIATNDVADAVDNLAEVLLEFTQLSMGENFFNVALQFSFAETLQEQFDSDLQELFSEMSKNGAKLTADMITAWTEGDWSAWTDALDDKLFGQLLTDRLDDLSGEIDFTEIWGGFANRDDFVKAVKRMTDESKTDVASIFSEMEMIAYIEAEWDNKQWDEIFNEGEIDLNKMQKLFDDAEIDVDIGSTWDGDTFDQFMTDLSSDKIVKLVNYLMEENISIPIWMEDLYTAAFEASVNGEQLWVNQNPIGVPTDFDETSGNETKTDFQKFLESLGWDAETGGYNIGKQMADGWLDGLKNNRDQITQESKDIVTQIRELILSSLGPIGWGINAGIDAIGGIINQPTAPSTPTAPTGSGVYYTAPGDEAAESVEIVGADAIQMVINAFPEKAELLTKVFEGGVKLSSDLFLQGTGEAGQQLFDDFINMGLNQKATATELKEMGLKAAQSQSEIINNTQNLFRSGVGLASMTFLERVGVAGNIITRAANRLNSVGYNQKGGIYNKPTMGVFGEKGAEALIPLEGKNRKYGREILSQILPSYYPELLGFQTGGIFTGGSSTSNVYNETYAMHGPINITTNNAEDFMEQLKYKFRASGR